MLSHFTLVFGLVFAQSAEKGYGCTETAHFEFLDQARSSVF